MAGRSRIYLCGLCKETYESTHALVNHYNDAHSIAKQRSRRKKTRLQNWMLAGEYDKMKDDMEEDEENSQEEAKYSLIFKQPLLCFSCGLQFATPAGLDSHSCNSQFQNKSDKPPSYCDYCGRQFKDQRGKAIHQAFCIAKGRSSSKLLKHTSHESRDMSLLECPSVECGAIFRCQEKLLRHIENHHIYDNISVIHVSSQQVVTSSPADCSLDLETETIVSSDSSSVEQPTPVTVTIRPHTGRTEGLQDLSLLVTPTKLDASSSLNDSSEESCIQGSEKDLPSSIKVEELQALEEDTGETVLYVTEDGTIIKALSGQDFRKNKVSIEITEDASGPKAESDQYTRSKTSEHICHICNDELKQHEKIASHLKQCHGVKPKINKQSIIKTKCEPKQWEGVSEDPDWELIYFNGYKKGNSKKGERRKLEISQLVKEKLKSVYSDSTLDLGCSEYTCSLCQRNFLSSTAFQLHVRNKDCEKKKFKLARMFACHFESCESSFFKLVDLQKHWKFAHSYVMTCETLTFDDQREFTAWLKQEEDKQKVRFTCDTQRKKPKRLERLLVCHRFHHHRTSAARKATHREYSDKHNWTYKIPTCLCYARMNVHIEFEADTCDYTGKITVIYYPEHTHNQDAEGLGNEEILNHILERHKRDRSHKFKDLVGYERILHRQKLERIARQGIKENQTSENGKDKGSKKDNDEEQLTEEVVVEMDVDEEAQLAAANVANSLLATDVLLASQVDMVLDGHFDMEPEELHTTVEGQSLEQLTQLQHGNSEEESYDKEKKGTDMEEASTMQVVLPASTSEWVKLFELVHAKISSENVTASEKAEAALLMPYQKVIELISPSDQVPIFRRLWDIAYPNYFVEANDSLEIKIAA